MTQDVTNGLSMQESKLTASDLKIMIGSLQTQGVCGLFGRGVVNLLGKRCGILRRRLLISRGVALSAVVPNGERHHDQRESEEQRTPPQARECEDGRHWTSSVPV